MTAWQPDPWYEKSEEFYQEVYAGGKCKFCGHPINSRLDVCSCRSMRIARERYKRQLRGIPEPIQYNPDAFIEPQEPLL